jgi:hypothetical protein
MQEEFFMKIEMISAARARALARLEKRSEEQVNEVVDLLQSLKDGDGVTITVEEGEELNKLIRLIRDIVKTEEMNISLRYLESRKQIVMWRKKKIT